MIYLFCNERYGLTFLRTASRFAHEHAAKITAVISTRGEETPPRWLVRWRASLAGIRRKTRFRRSFGISLLTAGNVNSDRFLARLRTGDDGIIAGFNQIFRADTIARFRSLVNFHPSVLPYYRGPVPSYWCLRNGEKRSGYTLHQVTPRIDDGNILYQEVVVVGGVCAPEALDQRIAERAAPVLWNYLIHLRTDNVWSPTYVNPNEVYSVRLDYASFPAKSDAGDPMGSLRRDSAHRCIAHNEDRV